MNLFELFATIGLDDSGFNKGIDDAQTRFDKFTEGIKKTTQSLKKTFDKATSLVAEISIDESDAVIAIDTVQEQILGLGENAKEASDKIENELSDINVPEIEIKIDDKALSSELDSATNEVEDFVDDADTEIEKLNKNTKSRMGEVATTIKQKFKEVSEDVTKNIKVISDSTKTLNKAALVVGAAFGVLGGIGLKYSADMEMYTTNFAVMLGSQEAAVAKVEELKVMAAKTPFEMADLAQGTQTLLAFNISATESTGILQMLGDVSLGNSQKLETLSRAYGKMSSSRKVSLEDINMMIDSGFNPLLTVAEKTGESMESMYARVSKGQVGVNEITDAFKTATSEGGQFYNGMEEASKTLTGQMSTLKDGINSALGEIFLPLAKQLSEETLPALNEKLTNFNDKLIEGDYANLISGVISVVTALGVALVALNLIVLFNDIMNVTKGIEGYTAVTKLGTVAQGIFNAVAALNPFTLMVIAIVAATTALVVFWKTNEGFRNAMKELWADIKKAFNETLDNMKEKIEGYKQIGKDIIDNLLSGLKSAWQPVEDWINEKLGPLDDKLKSLGLGGGNTKAQDAGLRPNGRHANGISSVPFDGYVGVLHKNERVLTASENRSYNQSGGQDTGLLQEMVAELKALRQEVYRQPERQQNLMRMGVVK